MKQMKEVMRQKYLPVSLRLGMLVVAVAVPWRNYPVALAPQVRGMAPVAVADVVVQRRHCAHKRAPRKA